jgi:alcohol dehydrogenase
MSPLLLTTDNALLKSSAAVILSASHHNSPERVLAKDPSHSSTLRLNKRLRLYLMQTPTILTPSLSPQSLPGSRIRVVYHAGALDHLGPIAQAEGASRVLLVSDPGIVAAGHVERAMRSLYQAGILARLYDGVGENPTTDHVNRGLAIAKKFEINFIIGLGGGSSMDCAKAVNFLLTSGGKIEDYWGVNKATNPMLPLIAIPTTAGTGSEAQSAALITDPATHKKMACWDEKAAAKIAMLDPDLTLTQPKAVAAATGIDAISHAVETAGSTKRNETSLRFSKAAWDLLSGAFEAATEGSGLRVQGGEGSGLRVQGSGNAEMETHQSAIRHPQSATPPSSLNPLLPLPAMLLGAHLAGCAIENSMLGAAHACANPLTAHFGVVHGHAVGLMLPHVIRFNSANDHHPYAALGLDPEALAQKIDSLLKAAHLPRTFADAGADPAAIPEMAQAAAKQWTATFNPRKVGPEELAEIYAKAARS